MGSLLGKRVIEPADKAYTNLRGNDTTEVVGLGEEGEEERRGREQAASV
jgi:hypothetical protein